MKKILSILFIALAVFTGCSDNDTLDNFRTGLYIDTENVAVEGSYVQGAEIGSLSKVTIPYQNAIGGSATISAPVSNGIYVSSQNVTLNNGSGEVVVTVSGIPVELRNTFLQLNVVYNGKTYISSAEIPVIMDADPSGTIDFDIDGSAITSLLEPVEIPFTVDPTMTAVVVSSEASTVLAVKVEQDLELGTGTVTITPSGAFLSGEVELTATFGVRPEQVVKIDLSAFGAGDGETTPYEISEPGQFAKIASGLGLKYKITEDLELGTISPVAGTFTGSLDGDSHKIEYNVNTPASDNAALFATLGDGATVSGLTLEGSVTGQDNVAALAATNNGATVTAIDASGVTITGRSNVAVLSATGAGADASVLKFTDTPTVLNITQGTTSGSAALGIAPVNAEVAVNLGSTGLASSSYSTTTGILTLNMPTNPEDFVPGNITFTAKLPGVTNLTSTVRMIDVKSEKMYESGSGIEGDPYLVATADQLNATMTSYPASFIKLLNDVEVTSWATISSFSGKLDGDGFTVSGLNAPFITKSTGTVYDIKFTNVNVTVTSGGYYGAVANETDGGRFEKIAVVGSLTRTTATGDQPFGGIVGEVNNANSGNSTVITNCYVNVVMSSSVSAVGGIVGRVNSASGKPATTISFCTSEGEILINGSLTKIGGILGRKQNNGSSAAKTDIITNCESGMIIRSGTGDTGSNMIGGIFGAQQPGVETPAFVTIDQCLFRGRVSGNNNVGGIGGICPPVSNSMVLGEGPEAANSTVGAAAGGSTAASAGISSGAKGNVTYCIVANARITGPSSGTTKFAAGIVSTRNAGSILANHNVIVNTSVTAPGENPGGFAVYGTAATGTNNVTATDNYYSDVTYTGGSPYVPLETDTFGQDGTAVSSAAMNQAWYAGIGYDFATVWKWDAAAGHPVLQNVGCDSSVIPQ